MYNVPLLDVGEMQVGDMVVLLNPDLDYELDESNPVTSLHSTHVGEVININFESVDVRWQNGMINNYKSGELAFESDWTDFAVSQLDKSIRPAEQGRYVSIW